MRHALSHAIALGLALGACDGRVVLGSDTPSLACDETPRDAARWPFSSDSPWNAPMGDRARYADVVTGAGPFASAGLAVSAWAQPIYVAAPADPATTFSLGDGTLCATLPVPADATPDPSPGGYLDVVDPTHRTLVETWQAMRTGPTSFVVGACWVNDLSGPGVYDTHHGIRGYGGSAIGGVIREGELTRGIRHVLAACVPAEQLDGLGPLPYVWPASSANDGWETAYGTTGNVRIGTRLAIPPTVDVDALPLSPAMHRVATALVDYGAYVTDACGGGVGLTAEPASAGEVPTDVDAALALLVPLLAVVSDASPTAPGGAGDPRACPAPPLSPSP